MIRRGGGPENALIWMTLFMDGPLLKRLLFVEVRLADLALIFSVEEEWVVLIVWTVFPTFHQARINKFGKRSQDI